MDRPNRCDEGSSTVGLLTEHQSPVNRATWHEWMNGRLTTERLLDRRSDVKVNFNKNLIGAGIFTKRGWPYLRRRKLSGRDDRDLTSSSGGEAAPPIITTKQVCGALPTLSLVEPKLRALSSLLAFRLCSQYFVLVLRLRASRPTY